MKKEKRKETGIEESKVEEEKDKREEEDPQKVRGRKKNYKLQNNFKLSMTKEERVVQM